MWKLDKGKNSQNGQQLNVSPCMRVDCRYPTHGHFACSHAYGGQRFFRHSILHCSQTQVVVGGATRKMSKGTSIYDVRTEGGVQKYSKFADKQNGT